MVIDEPAHRTAGVGLEAAGRHRRLLDQRRARRVVGQAAEHGRRLRRCGGGQRAVALGRRRCALERPRHLRQRAAADGERGVEQRPHVVEKERRRGQAALLVGRAVAEHEPLGRARGARVEEVALVGQGVTRDERQAGAGQASAQGVVEERVGRWNPWELALL